MRFAVTFVFAVLLTCRSGYADKPSQRPEAPKGYAWQELPEVKGAVLVPDGWHFSQTKTPHALAYRIGKEQLANGIFLTGMTINVVKDCEEKTKLKPSLYAVHHTKKYIENVASATKPKVDQVGKMQRITCFVEKEMPNVKKDVVFRIRFTTIANDESGTLFMIIFGAPKDAWEKDYEFGKQMFSPIVFGADA